MTFTGTCQKMMARAMHILGKNDAHLFVYLILIYYFQEKKLKSHNNYAHRLNEIFVFDWRLNSLKFEQRIYVKLTRCSTITDCHHTVQMLSGITGLCIMLFIVKLGLIDARAYWSIRFIQDKFESFFSFKIAKVST
jgi:hypothetical protein